jgi:two-component sensor histidine kinase/CheY-like chemotaxis protein
MMGVSPDSFGATLQGAVKLVHPDDREKFLNLVNQGIAEGRDGTCEIRFLREDGSVRWSLAAGQVIKDSNDRTAHFAGIDLDITERKAAEEQQNLLVRELDHRAKNLLAVVQSIVRLSRAPTTQEFVDAVEGRILALSRMHSLLSENRWTKVDLERLVMEELVPFRSGEKGLFTVDGPPLAITPGTAQSVAICVHELLTNALKYGALSTPAGAVSLTWKLHADSFVLNWTESGGPSVQQPSRNGFGVRVIVANLESLGGSADFDWRPKGLCCQLTIPSSNLSRGDPGKMEDSPAESAIRTGLPRQLSGATILLVEDEFLIAALSKDLLMDLGFSVIGPIADRDQAVTVASNATVSAAILDINLNGDLSYPVADVLARRSIPFAFMTGFGSAAIDTRYAHVPVLQKPIDVEALRKLFQPAAGADLQAARVG